MAVGCLFVAFALCAALMPAQNDTFWHLRAGADIWRTGAVPRVDHYSHTFPGAPWPDHEWLAQVLMFGAYRLAGMPGLQLAAAALLLGAVVLTWRLMVGPPATRAVVMTIGLVLSSSVWALRPHVLSLFLLAVLLTMVVRERYRLIPLLFVLWANAHGGVVLGGLALATAFAVAALRWRRSRDPADARRARVLAVVVALSGLACAASPLGFSIYRFVVESTGRSIAIGITEWFPLLPTDRFGVLFWAIMLVWLGLLVHRRRELAGGRCSSWADWVTVATALMMLPLAIRSARNTGPFVLLAVVAANRLLGADFRFRAVVERLRRPRLPAKPPAPDRPRLNLALLAIVSIAAVAAIGVVFRFGDALLGWRPISDGALAATRACDGPLYNRYGDGGTLIWFLPDRPVFVDGRQDPYPLPFLLEAVALEARRKPYLHLFDQWRIRCAFLPADSETAADLTRDGWAVRFKDDKWQVLAAPAVPAAPQRR